MYAIRSYYGFFRLTPAAIPFSIISRPVLSVSWNLVSSRSCELNANEEQLDFPIVYASAKNGYAKHELADDSDNLEPLFQMIRVKVA